MEAAIRASGSTAVAALLEGPVRDFESDPIGMGRAIRALFDNRLEAFRAAVPYLLKQPGWSRGMRYLVALLIAQDLLAEAIASPELSLGEAIAAARLAIQIDSVADRKLARSLVAASPPFDSARTMRLLAVLGEVSEPGRILTPAAALLNHSNPHIRSKAALFIGRGGHNPAWLERALEEPDPRVRANAIEALWGVPGEPARELMRVAAGDRHNRVAANALMALHAAGDTNALRQMVRMSLRPEPAFRASAAWAMGETGDPRFSVVLARLISEPNPAVRRRAFRALSRLRETIARRQRHGCLTIATGIPRPAPGGHRAVAVSIAPLPGGSLPHLLPTHFAISEDSEPVFEYEVEPLVQPESLAVAMVLPRRLGAAPPEWLDAALASVSRKRNCDSWWVIPFDGQRPGMDESGLPPPPFTADAAMLAGHLKKWDGEGARGAWTSLKRALLVPGPLRASRHLLILREGGNALDAAPVSLAEDARSFGTAVHAVSGGSDTALERLCRETGGVFTLQEPDEPVGAALERGCLRILPQYAVTWLPLHPARRFLLQIGCEEGWGEDAGR